MWKKCHFFAERPLRFPYAAKSRSDVGVQGGQIQRPLPGSSVGQRRAVQWADSGGGVTGQHPIPKHTRQRRARHLPQGLLYATSMANMPCKLAEPRMCAQPVTHKRTWQSPVAVARAGSTTKGSMGCIRNMLIININVYDCMWHGEVCVEFRSKFSFLVIIF